MNVTQPVDAVLAEAVRLLGTGPPPTATAPPAPGELPPYPQWQGDAGDRARLVSAQLETQREQLYSAGARTAGLIGHAATITTEARSQLAAIHSQWESDKAAVGPFIDTPAGQAALAAAGQARVQEANGVVTDAASRFGAAAQDVRAAVGSLPRGTGSNTQPAGFTAERPPLAPPFKQSPDNPHPDLVTPAENPYPVDDPRHEKVEELNRKLIKYGIDAAAYIDKPPPTNPAEYEERFSEWVNLNKDLTEIAAGYVQYDIQFNTRPPIAPTPPGGGHR